MAGVNNSNNNNNNDVTDEKLFENMVFRMRPCSAKARIKKHILVCNLFWC